MSRGGAGQLGRAAGRVLSGARIAAAEEAFGLLIERLEAVAARGRLALAVAAAADLLASLNDEGQHLGGQCAAA